MKGFCAMTWALLALFVLCGGEEVPVVKRQIYFGPGSAFKTNRTRLVFPVPTENAPIVGKTNRYITFDEFSALKNGTIPITDYYFYNIVTRTVNPETLALTPSIKSYKEPRSILKPEAKAEPLIANKSDSKKHELTSDQQESRTFFHPHYIPPQKGILDKGKWSHEAVPSQLQCQRCCNDLTVQPPVFGYGYSRLSETHFPPVSNNLPVIQKQCCQNGFQKCCSLPQAPALIHPPFPKPHPNHGHWTGKGFNNNFQSKGYDYLKGSNCCNFGWGKTKGPKKQVILGYYKGSEFGQGYRNGRGWGSNSGRYWGGTKPGTCYRSNNSAGWFFNRRKREDLSTLYGGDYKGGYYYGPIHGGKGGGRGRGYCGNDYDCPGNKKCCYGYCRTPAIIG